MKHPNHYFILLAATLGTLICPTAARAESLSIPLEGTWKATAATDSEERHYLMTVTKKGDAFGGSIVEDGKDNPRSLDRIKIDGKKVTIEIDIEVDAQKGTITVTAEEGEPGKLTGKWSIADTAGTEYLSGKWVGEKEIQATLAGTWDALATLPDGGELKAVTTVEGAGPDYKGKSESEQGSTEIPKIRQDGNSVSMDFAVVLEGNEMNVKIKSELDGDTLTGKWILLDATGNEAATGDWKASRRKEFAFEGNWKLVAILPEGEEIAGTLVIVKEEGSFGGRAEFDAGGIDLKSVSSDKGAVAFSLDYAKDGTVGTVALKGKAENSVIKGTWEFTSSDGAENSKGEWSATKSEDLPGRLRGRE